MRIRPDVWLVALALVPGACSGGRQEAFLLEKVVDERYTFLLVKVPEAGAFVKGVRQTGLGKLLEDPKFAEFLERLMAAEESGAAFFKAFRSALRDLEKLETLGDVSLAALNPEQDNPDILLTIDGRGRGDTETFLRGKAEDAFEGYTKTMEKIAGLEVAVYARASGVPAAYVGKMGDTLFLANSAKAVETLKGRPEKPVCASAAYAHAKKAVGQGGVLAYLDLRPLVKLGRKETPADALFVFDMLNLDSLVYAAASVSLEGNDFVVRGHLCTNLESEKPLLPDELASGVSRDPRVRMQSLSYSDNEKQVKQLWENMVPFLQQVLKERQPEDAGREPVDLSTFPIETVAKYSGRSTSVFAATDDGFSYYGRSPLLFPVQMSGDITWFTVLGAIAAPPTAGAGAAANKIKCMNNLGMLGRCMEIYRKEFGGPNYELPSQTGKAFLQEMIDRGVFEAGSGLVTCPASGQPPGAITYRGPARNVNDPRNYGERDVILCDDPGNHPDGVHALLKDYEVVWIPAGTPEYEQALRNTKE